MQTHRIERFRTRLGIVETIHSEAGLASLHFIDYASPGAARSDLSRRIQDHFNGVSQDFSDILLDFRGCTDFERKVYLAAQRIPSGTTKTYGDVAREIGSPKGARAVGGALGKNRHLLLVPCHRVIGSQGRLTGFSAPGGLETKDLMLAAEGWGTESLWEHREMELGLEHLKSDPDLGSILAQVGPCTLSQSKADRPFVALARTVLYQQLATGAARAIEERLEKLGERGFPSAEELMEISEERLKGAGLSGPKVRALKNVAKESLEGNLKVDELRLLPDQQVIEQITKVKGLGPWSAEMFLIFHLGRRDRFPVGDLGIRNALKRLFPGKKLDKATTLERTASRWEPYRTLASWYLWRSLEL